MPLKAHCLCLMHETQELVLLQGKWDQSLIIIQSRSHLILFVILRQNSADETSGNFLGRRRRSLHSRPGNSLAIRTKLMPIVATFTGFSAMVVGSFYKMILWRQLCRPSWSENVTIRWLDFNDWAFHFQCVANATFFTNFVTFAWEW